MTLSLALFEAAIR